MTDSANRRTVLVKSMAFATAGAMSAASHAAVPGPTTYKAIFQVSDADPAKWNLTLNNVHNAQTELGHDNVAIEVVAYGPGIGMLKADADVAARVTEAAQAGITLLACENTMRGQKLTHEQMNAKVGYVPSGVAHLIRRQAEGYAYIRS